jgi:DNA-binding NarL/FixJ family response regulator
MTMKVAIIMGNDETRVSLQQYLSEDKRVFRRVFAFNSIDTFISDAYMLTDVNVVLIDMHLQAGLTSVEGLDIISKTPYLAKAKVLMFTSVSDTNYTVFKWLCNHESSYIDKEMSLFNIKNAIVSFSQKTELLLPVITKHRSAKKVEGASGYSPVAPLTTREKQVIQHVIDRENESEIARNLNIRRGLVRKYIRTAYHKIQESTASLSLIMTNPDALEVNYKRVG